MLHKRMLTQLIALVVIFSLARGPSSAAELMAESPPLGAAETFSVLAALSMSAAGAGTTVSGDLGLSPGLAVSRTGAWTVGGTEYFGTGGLSEAAQTDALSAFNNLAGQSSDGPWGASPWNPMPGVWTVASDVTFAGDLTLSGGYNDVWVFQVGRDMTFSGNVILAENAQACNVFWQVGRDATIAAGSAFVGTLIASRDIFLLSGATVDGRLISLNSSLTTDGNVITTLACVQAPQTITTEIRDHLTGLEVFSAPVGTIVHDMAIISGTLGITPTGTVTFTVYHTLDCTGAGAFAGAIPLVASASGVSEANHSYTATLTSDGLSYLAYYGGDHNYDAGYGPCERLDVEPTAVELLYFQASPLHDQQVQLQWATALEVDNFGFNLYRADTNDVRHASLIHFEPASAQGGGSGATYAYVDTVPYTGRWWYWLSDVDTYGRETFHDTPITIALQPNTLHYIYLPLISKQSLEASVLGNWYRSR